MKRTVWSRWLVAGLIGAVVTPAWAETAASPPPASLDRLESHVATIARHVATIRDGRAPLDGSHAALVDRRAAATQAFASTDDDGLRRAWAELDTALATVVTGRDALTRLHAVRDAIAQATMPLILGTDEINHALIKAEGTAALQTMYLSTRQPVLLLRIGDTLDALTATPFNATVLMDRLARDTKMVAVTYDGLANGNDALGITKIGDADTAAMAGALATQFAPVQDAVVTLLDDADTIVATQEAVTAAIDAADALLADIDGRRR